MEKTKSLDILLTAPYDSGGIRMVDYENMVKAPRLNWLKRIADDS